MTNDEIAEMIAERNGNQHYCKNCDDCCQPYDSTDDCFKSAMQAMELKNEQFNGFLFELALKITTPKTDLDKTLASAFPMAGLNAVDDILTSLQNDWYDYQDKGTILNG